MWGFTFLLRFHCPQMCFPLLAMPAQPSLALPISTLPWMHSPPTSFPAGSLGPLQTRDSDQGSGRRRARSLVLDFTDIHGNPLQYSCLEKPRDRGA